ncbi:MAG: hypothetical protein AABZ39_02210 [Spirochaetota bacterium]|mgnify:CR=1 FL=1
MKKRMHIASALAALAIFASAAFAGTNESRDPLNCHRIEASWGFYRTGYFYPISGVRYETPALGIPLSLSAALRSYGSFYLVSIRSFDVSASVSYRFDIIPRFLLVTAGAGGTVAARLYNDTRSTASSGFYPYLTGGIAVSFGWCTLSLPVQVNFFGDGIGITGAPEAAFRLDFIGLFIRSELSVNHVWAGTTGLFADNYAGIRLYF